MKILVLNVGSSSIKYSVYEDEKFLFKGKIEEVKNFEKGVKEVMRQLEEEEIKVEVIGHRIVHAGFVEKAELINEKVLKKVKKFSDLAPLHNIPEIKVIEACKKFKLKQVAVYDSVFYKSLKKKVYVYALPYRYYKKYGIRKLGFHGISHQYVSERVNELMKKKNFRLISVHLGAGCSITAIKNGKAIDTSMGFTPLEGLMMGTRSGDIDAGVILFLMKHEKLKKLNKVLNEESGLLGISGSSDFRKIRKSKEKNRKLAYDMFVDRVVKYIGSYVGVLDGVDVISFTGGIGENVSKLREDVLENFKFLGVKLDNSKNKRGEETISSKDSKVKVFVIKTDEEAIIVREVRKIIR